MPPKPAAGKKGDEVDFTDLDQLPQVQGCNVQIHFTRFKSAAVRNKVSEHLKGNLPEKVVRLDREEIKAYAASKGIEAGGEGGLTAEQVLARSAADKLFEIEVTQRRVKKEAIESGRTSSMQDAQVASQTNLNSVTAVVDQIDYMVLMPDYPSTAAESLALSQYSQSVNCLFDVHQIQETNEGVAPADLKNGKEVVVGCDGGEGDDSVAHAEALEIQMSELKGAMNRSAMNAPIRNCAVFKVPYCDADPVDIKQEQEGEPPATNILKAEEAFTKSFINENLENSSQLYLNFVLFKQLVDLHTLMPDKAVMAEIKELKEARATYEMMKHDRENQMKELEAAALTDEQKENMAEDQIAEHENAIAEQKTALEADIQEADQEAEQREARFSELLVEAKRSLDDENKEKKNHFSDKVYKQSFLPTKESANTITSVVSAMVEQIAAEREEANFDSPEREVDIDSTENETLDDLFDQFKEEIAFCTNLKERQPADTEFEQTSLKGQLNQDFNVFETFDTSSIPIQTMPVNEVDSYQDYAHKIAQREKNAGRNLQIPGCNRYQMPPVAQKSKRLRGIENVQFYPFSTLPIEDAERMLQLKEFASMYKSLGIYENEQGKDKQSKNKVFERKFDEYLQTDSLRSVVQQALLMNPDVATAYYPRTDQLMLLLYNRVNGAKRASQNKEKPHGFRNWKAEERVMPSFQGFIDNFGPNVIQQDPNYVPADDTQPPQKLILAADMLPKALLDVDEKRVANISQGVQQFFPDCNAILTSEEYEIGGVHRVNSTVHKDNTNFGLRISENKQHLPVEHQYGLVSYKPIGTHELWLNFSDKETKLHVENVEVVRNKRKMQEIKPPPKTEEELAADAKRIEEAIALAKKEKREYIPEPEAETIFQEAPADYLDELFDDSELNEISRGPCATSTLKNGLMVRHMADGKIVQIKESMLTKDSDVKETSRVMINKGVIVRNFSNNDCEVMHPSGEVAYFDRANLKWTLTNEKGLRRQTQNGVSTDLAPLNCLKQTDVHTGIVTRLRADKVMLITYANGATYCQHADGTQIYTDVEGAEIRVEKEGFAPVTYTKIDKAEDLEEWLDVEGIRSVDGWVIDVHLPDGCHIKTVKYMKDSENTDHILTKHIYLREDFSTFMIDAEGDFRVITTSGRTSINDSDERARIGNDTDYLKELVRDKDTLTPGVFYGCISPEENGSYVICRDSNKPFTYTINSQNKLIKANYEKFERNDDWAPVDLGEKFDPEIELVNVNRNPFQRNFIFPRMFIINSEGDGIELLSQDQLDRYVRNVQHRQDTLTTMRVEQVETCQLNAVNIMGKVTSLRENELDNNQISARLKFPEYAQPYVIKMRSDEDLKKLKPRQDQYQCRNLTEYSVFDQMKQQYFVDDWTRFNEWKMSQVRYDTEFGIVHHAPKDQQIDWDEIEDIEYMAQKINMKIYKERALQREPFDRNEFRLNFESNWNKDVNVISFRKKNTTVAKEEEEIAAREHQRELEAIKAKELAEKRALEEHAAQKRQAKKEHTRAKVDGRLNAFDSMKETPSFVGQYHKSRAGMKYHEENPVKPPTDEVLMRMSQRINRSQQQTDKQGVQSIFDGNSHRSGNSQDKPMDQTQVNADNPIVALEPEDQFNKSGVDKSKKLTSVSKQTGDDQMDVTQMPAKPTASLYMQEKKYLKQLEQEKILKAEEHHVIKTKDFDVFGKLRQDKPYVKSTAKSNMPSELNEKFITTECITDRRIKISSMANRQYMQAPSIEQVRKQGQHQMIMQAVQKKQTFSELINQANSMVTSVLHDNMKRAVNIMPSFVNFGGLPVGQEAEFTVTVKNEDSLSQRIHIKPCTDKRIIVKQESYGPIAPGMTRKVLVSVVSGEPGKIKEEVHIVTKSDVFKLKIEAEVMDHSSFDEKNQEALQRSNGKKNATNSRVRTQLHASIATGKKLSLMDTVAKAEAPDDAEQEVTSKVSFSANRRDGQHGSEPNIEE